MKFIFPLTMQNNYSPHSTPSRTEHGTKDQLTIFIKIEPSLDTKENCFELFRKHSLQQFHFWTKTKALLERQQKIEKTSKISQFILRNSEKLVLSIFK